MKNEPKSELKYERTFDRDTKRQKINGLRIVLHCHHYSTLYTQLALDADETELLKECARDCFREVLDSYFDDHPEVDNISEKIEIGCQYSLLMGLGEMVVNFVGPDSGEVELLSSHLDNGWKKKWGEHDEPVNYITAGFIEAMFESVLDEDPGTFEAVETDSIVMGDETSKFKITRC